MKSVSPLRAALSAVLAVLVMIGLVPATAAAHPGHSAPAEFRALLFTKVAAGSYWHDSIPAGISMVQKLAADNHFDLVTSDDSTLFDDATLATFDVIIMLQNGGMVWDTDAQRAAVKTYVNNGGGIVAIHNATDMNIESQFPWWDDFVLAGSHMTAHSANGLTATQYQIDEVHESTKHLPDRWQKAEEWYNFKPSLRGKVHPLVEVDEKTYNPGPEAMGTDHPISWCRDAEGGRVWATGLGHNIADYTEPNFVAHILGGIRTAAGVVAADCGATVDGSFEKVTLDDTTRAPTSLDIAPDGRVFFTELLGEIRVYDPATGSTSTALSKPVYSGGEDGMISVALAPDFATSKHLYAYYSPPGTAEVNRLSRFTVSGNVIVPSSEVTVLEVPAARREEPGHTGGYIEFGPNGNLYLGVGDDTNPFQSSGYAPIDERPGRDLFDAQKTSANTDDLRGKILRIHPEADGTYTIPAGNMFAPGTAKTRPEIYAMGFRNPFRFNVASDGTLYLADYGPDAGSDNASRGPAGLVEWNVIKSPGNYGWPYCVGNNIPFNDFDFATNTSGAKFDCASPTNTSPNNTGLTALPAARVADVWYGNGADGNKFPEMGTGGEAPMAGPRYEYDPNLVSDTKFPQFYDGKPFFYDWTRNKFWTFSQDDAGALLKIDPWLTSATPASPMDMKFGPDGAMYLVEWGFGYGRDNPDSGVYRIDYTQGNRRPVAKMAATPSSGQAPLAVSFSSAGSADPEGSALTYAWAFGDGSTGSGASPTHTYSANGVYNAQLTVSDASGKSGVANVTVTVGNTAPSVTMASPVDGGFFDFGDSVAFDLDITDPEDGQPDCGRVVVQPALGHEAHAHPIDQIKACSGQFTTLVDEGHADSDIFYSVDASYTDGGAGTLPPLVGRDVAVIQPKHKQAEFSAESSGVTAQADAAAEAGKRVGDISGGDWIAFTPVNLHQISRVTARVSAATAGGSIELRKDSPTGALVATIPVPATGSGYATLPDVAVTDPGGTMKLVAVFRATTANQFTVDSFTFIGKGVSVNAAPHVVVAAQPTTGSAPLTVAFTATATDAENNTPFAYAWNFGDGGTGSGASVSHTYTAAGTFTATVTVTDSAGRTKTVSTPVVVRAAPMPPITCGVPDPQVSASDEFDSDRLDGCRWDAVVRPDLSTMHMAGGRLSIETQPGDINGGANENPRNFVLQNAPAGDWTLQTRIAAPLVEKYQLAGLMVYGNDDDYVKFDVVAVNNAGSAPSLRAELVSENAAQFGNGGNQSIALGSPESGWWHLRLKKTGSSYTGEISDGGTTWTSLGAAVTNDVPSPKVGVMAIGPQQTNGPVTVDFDWFHLDSSELPPITCATPGTDLPPNDEFGSDRLDGCRWDAVVRPDLSALRMADGRLSVTTQPGDIYGGANENPRNFVLQNAPAGDWTVETRIAAPLLERYQLAGLMVYGNDDDYVKFDVVAVNAPGSAASLRAELVAENAAQFGNGGNRSIALSAPSSGWWQLRLKKTGSSYTGEISGDGTTWTSLGAAVTNDVPAPKVGVMAIGPQQTNPVKVDFDWFRLRQPDLPAITCGVPDPQISYTDEFDSDRLDGCRWDAVVRPDLPTIHMTGGRLSIDTQPGDIYGGANENPRNFVLQNAPAGNWTLETRIAAPLLERYQLAGLMVYGNDDDYVKFDVVAVNAPGSAPSLRAELVAENAAQFGSGGNRSVALSAPSSGWWQLRLKKTGTDYTGEISGDGTTWTSLGAAVSNDVPSPKFGVMAIGPQQTGSVRVDFDWFRVSGLDTAAPTVAASATEPTGTDGWWTTAPTVSISARDDESGVASTEYRVDSGEWSPYTEPFAVSGDGTHVVEYRATDAVGNTSPHGLLTVKVDASAPTVSVSGLVDGSSYGHSVDRVVGWQAADATSGIGSVSATLDGTPLTADQTVAMRGLALGAHRAVVTTTDKAGHTRQVSVSFTVVTSVPDLRALVDRFAAERRITDTTATALRDHLDKTPRLIESGDSAKAADKLEEFRKLAARQVADVPARDLLVGDADAVISALRGN